LDALISNKNQEHNRLDVSEPSLVIHIQRHIDFIEKEIKEVESIIVEHIKLHKDLQDNSNLLASIPGIGEITLSIIISSCNVKDFDSVKQVVAFFGLNPKPRQSGSSLKGASRISKMGRSELRKALYMPALTAIRYNPIIKEFAERLESAGKSKMVIIIAAMRKLLHIIYGVLKNQNPFNENKK
jgi:transposase